MKHVVRLLVIGITVAGFLAPNSFGQGVTINPYFGGVWPDSSGVGELKTNALWGVRAGVHVDPSLAIEGNFGYLNHFEVKGTDPKSRGFIWDFGPSYFFSSEDWPIPSGITPHLSFSVGGITTRMKDTGSFMYPVFGQTQFVGGPPQTTVRQIEMRSGDTFFTASGGGGFRVNPGPVGVRADLRARMMPNYYRSSPVWLEATVGLSFVVGRR